MSPVRARSPALSSAPVDRDDLERLGDPLERDRLRLGVLQAVGELRGREAGVDLARAAEGADASGLVHALAVVVRAGAARVGRVNADADLGREAVRATVL